MSLVDALKLSNLATAYSNGQKICSPDRGNYDAHYPAILKWFEQANRTGWDVDKVIQGSLIVYGWMPTILEGRKQTANIDAYRPREFSEWLNKAKEDLPAPDPVIWKAVNDSFVGTSKFLHFWRPKCFGIWDINVARSLLDSEDDARKLRYDQIEKLNIVKKYQCLIRKMAEQQDDGTIRDIEEKLFRFGQSRSPKKKSK